MNVAGARAIIQPLADEAMVECRMPMRVWNAEKGVFGVILQDAENAGGVPCQVKASFVIAPDTIDAEVECLARLALNAMKLGVTCTRTAIRSADGSQS